VKTTATSLGISLAGASIMIFSTPTAALII
jgi:hypothetical protein